MSVPHHSFFYRSDALPAAQPTASNTEGKLSYLEQLNKTTTVWIWINRTITIYSFLLDHQLQLCYSELQGWSITSSRSCCSWIMSGLTPAGSVLAMLSCSSFSVDDVPFMLSQNFSATVRACSRSDWRLSAFDLITANVLSSSSTLCCRSAQPRTTIVRIRHTQMVKVIWQKGRIADANGWFNCTHQDVPTCTPI